MKSQPCKTTARHRRSDGIFATRRHGDPACALTGPPGTQGGRLAHVSLASNGPGKTQVIAGAKVVKGKELGKLFETAVLQDSDNVAKIQLNVASSKSSSIHAITLPADDAFVKDFGDGPAHLAFADDAIWFCLGADSLSAVKGALEATPAKTTLSQQTRAPISLRIGLSKLMPLVAAADPNVQTLAKTAFTDGHDELALEVARQPNGAKIRFEVQEGILRLLGQIGAARAGQRN